METESDLQSDAEENQDSFNESKGNTGLLTIDGMDDEDDGYAPPTNAEGGHLPINTDTQEIDDQNKSNDRNTDVWGDKVSDDEKPETQGTRARPHANESDLESDQGSDRDDNDGKNFLASDSESDSGRDDYGDYGSNSSSKKEKKPRKKREGKGEKDNSEKPHRTRQVRGDKFDDSLLPSDVRDFFKNEKLVYTDNEDKDMLDAQAEQILNEMDRALKADSNAHDLGNNNSFERIKFLKRLDKLTTNKALLKALRQHGLLSYCEAYLLPYEDGTFPLYSIRMDVIKILEKVPTVNTDDLKGADGKGQLLIVLQNPPELHDKADCPLCKRSLALIQKWKRIIVGANEVTTYVPEDVREKMSRSSEAVAPLLPAYNALEHELNQALAKHRRNPGARMDYTPMEVFIDKPKLKKKKGLPTRTRAVPTSEPT